MGSSPVSGLATFKKVRKQVPVGGKQLNPFNTKSKFYPSPSAVKLAAEVLNAKRLGPEESKRLGLSPQFETPKESPKAKAFVQDCSSPSPSPVKLAAEVLNVKRLGPKETNRMVLSTQSETPKKSPVGPETESMVLSTQSETPKESPKAKAFVQDNVVGQDISCADTDSDDASLSTIPDGLTHYFQWGSGTAYPLGPYAPLRFDSNNKDARSLHLQTIIGNSALFALEGNVLNFVGTNKCLSLKHEIQCLRVLHKWKELGSEDYTRFQTALLDILVHVRNLPGHLKSGWKAMPESLVKVSVGIRDSLGKYYQTPSQKTSSQKTPDNLQIPNLTGLPKFCDKAHSHMTMEVEGYTAYTLLAAMALGYDRQTLFPKFSMVNLWERSDTSGDEVQHNILQKVRSIFTYLTNGVADALNTTRRLRFSLKHLHDKFTDSSVENSTDRMAKVTILEASKRMQDVEAPAGKYYIASPEYANMDSKFTDGGSNASDLFLTEYPEILVASLVVDELQMDHTLVIDNKRKAGTWLGGQSNWTPLRDEEQNAFWHTTTPQDGLLIIPETEKCSKDKQHETEEILKELNLMLGALSGDIDRARMLVAGPWGKLSDGGDPELKFMIQWIAASMSGMELSYVPDAAVEVADLRAAVDAARNHSVGMVWKNFKKAVSSNPNDLLKTFTDLNK